MAVEREWVCEVAVCSRPVPCDELALGLPGGQALRSPGRIAVGRVLAEAQAEGSEAIRQQGNDGWPTEEDVVVRVKDGVFALWVERVNDVTPKIVRLCLEVDSRTRIQCPVRLLELRRRRPTYHRDRACVRREAVEAS